ncbi:MAG: hypothetical protein M3P91_02110 [Actinomycetota bacterium]|nr:hypothetical protein [Actinomycetota bacterium]
MSTSGSIRTAGPTPEAPLTTELPPRTLGLRDALGLWGNLGVSLLLPVAVFVVLTGRPLSETLGVIVPGALVGAVLLGLAASLVVLPGRRRRRRSGVVT